MRNLFLHRDDLRIKDNKGLKKASQNAETLPVYIEDPRITERIGKNKKAFREESIKKLKQKYRSENSDLLIKKGKTGEELRKLVKDKKIKKIYFNRSYTPLKRRIGREVRELDINTDSFKDRLLVEPQENSKEYGTFSPFYREWKEKEKEKPFENPSNLIGDRFGEFETNGSDIELPEAGEEAAQQKWREFKEKGLEEYKDKRDDVSQPKSVSRMSFHYSNGTIGIRKVKSDVEELISRETDSGKIRNYAKYRNELAWREFFYQVLYHNPETVEQNYRDFENKINWKNDSEELEAWKKGETGVPFVDAGIRELRKTGYMHNRTRQNVASFLTKHLMIDWRKGARFFRKHLIDHDTASNIGGWQWAASTGTDSVSIRIFNPVKQGRKYDTHAEYIKRHIPELRDLDPNSIHNWVEMSHEERNNYETEYPEPIINFNQRYHIGKKMFENAINK